MKKEEINSIKRLIRAYYGIFVSNFTGKEIKKWDDEFKEAEKELDKLALLPPNRVSKG